MKKIYSVERYFDDHWEKTIFTSYDKEEANKKCQEYNNKPNHYISYQVREVNE